jgi:hypothetical protein
MFVGILKITLYLYQSNSLKEKRMILHSLKDRLRARFNVSVSEIESQDKWQKAVLAIVHVGTHRPAVDAILSKILNFLECYKIIDLADYELQII